MLEILALVTLTKKVGGIVEEKGHPSLGYKALTVILWFGGEILGAIVGTVMTNGDDSATCLIYIMALLGAGAGAWIAYAIAGGLPVVGPALTPKPAGSAPTSASLADPTAKLQKLKDLHASGLITDVDYETQKTEALSKLVNAPVVAPNKPYVPGRGTAIITLVLTFLGMVLLFPLVVSVPLAIYTIVKAEHRGPKITASIGLVLTALYGVGVMLIALQQ